MTLSIRCLHSFRLLAPGVALMLVALFPLTARANTAGQVYELAVPHIESDPTERAPKPEPPERSHPVHPTEPAVTAPDRAPTPTTGKGAVHRTPTKPDAEPEPKERHQHQEAMAANPENHPPTGGDQTSERSSTGATDGDGSSPAVPILIAVALLAAASIGFVLYRERKSRTGPVNP
jgi:outer membrane biosynthesis protein TonB